ncbi:hypothetical protein J2S43_006093 [Catenuloplanes nepalensis]|uniref:Uncharacterized protein n=1 Tax=Catenuloplanes nepalensis TaxID=587533 RepID=A0ABT9N2A5_9ACTN|nr:hypothetical protein [Catenuloplanes nepalensis]
MNTVLRRDGNHSVTGIWDGTLGPWSGDGRCGSMWSVTTAAHRSESLGAVTLGLTTRRHVDYGRVRSAICPAC